MDEGGDLRRLTFGLLEGQLRIGGRPVLKRKTAGESQLLGIHGEGRTPKTDLIITLVGKADVEAEERGGMESDQLKRGRQMKRRRTHSSSCRVSGRPMKAENSRSAK
jgi:hypothetical protein